MPRGAAPDIFVYRGADHDALYLETHPIKAAFFGNDNLRHVKTKIDGMGASIQLDTLQDLMRRAYDSDDNAQQSELLVASEPRFIPPFIDRLNTHVLAEIDFRMRSSAADFHRKFLDDSRAYLGDDIAGLYKFYDTERTHQRPRQHARDADEIEMFRHF